MNNIDNRPEQPDNKQWSVLAVVFFLLGIMIAVGLL